MSEVAQRAGALYIASNQNSDTLAAEKARRVMFMVPPDMSMALRTLAPYLAEHVGKKWYFLTHDYEWGWSGTKWGQRKILEQYKGTDLGESKIPLNTRDFSAFLLKARAAKPDALVLTVGGVDLAALMEQMFEFGIQKEMTIVNTLLNLEDLWAVGPREGRGDPHDGVGPHDRCPGRERVRGPVQETLPTSPIPVPTANTVNGYIGVRELLRGIERAGKDDVTAVIKAMEGATARVFLKNDPITIREWDHKFLWASYVVRVKKPNEMKDRADFVEILKWAPGKDTARTRQENPVNLGPYPERDAERRAAKRGVPSSPPRCCPGRTRAWPLPAVGVCGADPGTHASCVSREGVMTEFFPFLMNGVVLGLIFAVVALGFTLILGVMQVINFCHGILFAFGAYFAFSMQKYVGFWVALVVAPLLVGLVGLLLERIMIHRTYGGSPLFGLLLTFGLATALEEVIRMIWGKPGYSVAAPKFAAGSLDLGFMFYSKYRLILAALAILIILLVWLFLEKTPYGAIIKAGASDSEMIMALGKTCP